MQKVNKLEEKKYVQKCEQSMNKSMNITHDRLQSDCYQWFHNTHTYLRDLMWMNYNNPKNAAHGAVLKGMGMKAGVYDLLFYFNGSLYGFDMKVGSDKLSDKQLRWAQNIQLQGGQCFEIRNIEQFKKVISSILSANSSNKQAEPRNNSDF